MRPGITKDHPPNTMYRDEARPISAVRAGHSQLPIAEMLDVDTSTPGFLPVQSTSWDYWEVPVEGNVRPGITKDHPRNTIYRDEARPISAVRAGHSQPPIAEILDVDTSTPGFLPVQSTN